MENLVSLWQGLTKIRRMILVGSTLGVFVAILALARVSSSPTLSLLYAGLDPHASGEVIAALDGLATPYEVTGDAIYVPNELRDELRMQLAGEGLPSAGGGGYEILDGLSGFGTTSQMFDVAYWRAKEGELARTVLTMPLVRAARVHIAQGSTDGFMRGRKMSASVTVTLAGGSLTSEQANALRHLVASAVGGMQPGDVSVIDSVSGLISETDKSSAMAEDIRAADIKKNVERILSARVGAGNAVVEVALDLVRDREAISEKTFDPQARVAISSDNEKRSESASERDPGVTVASNLPEGDGSAGDKGTSQSSESRERVNYEVSHIQREVTREPGAIRRLHVAVLVDGQRTVDDNGKQNWQPRSETELADLRELVASAAGIEEARGDVLTLKSLEFKTLSASGDMVEAGNWSAVMQLDWSTMIRVFVLALVIIVLGLFVLRPVLLQRSSKMGLDSGRPKSLSNLDALPSGGAISGEIDNDFSLPTMAIMDFDEKGMRHDEREVPPDPVTRLRQLMGQRQAESVEILRNWMEKEESRG